MNAAAIIGPPGTGKTTSGMDQVRSWIDRGVDTRDIGYFTFTKSAAMEAVRRIQDDEVGEEVNAFYPHFRTIHSLCYRGLRAERKDLRVMGPADWKTFAQETGLEGSYSALPWEDLSEVFLSLQGQGKTEWDSARAAYTLTRLLARSEEDLHRARHEYHPRVAEQLGYVDGEQYRSFVRLYDNFRRKEGLIDFTDMLEYGLTQMSPVDCRRVIVDEAQDLCPCHFAIIKRLFGGAELVLWIGDDDQSIFRFSGASAEEFLAHVDLGAVVVLRQTHRFGQPIVDFSKQIIRRVEHRIGKDVIGVPGRKGDVSESGEWKPTYGDYFILHRHVRGCQAVGTQFIDAGIPFRNERGKSPLSSRNRVMAFQQLQRLASGEVIPMAKAKVAITELLPSTHQSYEGIKTRLVVHGAKKKLIDARNEPISLDTLVSKGLLTPEGARVVRQHDYSALHHTDDLRYYDRVLKNGYKLVPSGPVITTLHGSKGRQAPFVVLYSEMLRTCWNDPDSEHRLAYVGATRTQSNVVVTAEQVSDWTADEYPYPLDS
jgi:superfamily I DNA/RNA helicase